MRSADLCNVQIDDVRRQRILATVDSIPRGRVASYGQVARVALLPGRARLVGRVLNEASARDLPWHRVLGAAGKISIAPGTRAFVEQRKRLRREGVEVSATGRVDLERFAWKA